MSAHVTVFSCCVPVQCSYTGKIHHLCDADFSHLTSKRFFEAVKIKQGASTFPFQMPYQPADDVQKLDVRMAHTKDGGMSNVDNDEG